MNHLIKDKMTVASTFRFQRSLSLKEPLKIKQGPVIHQTKQDLSGLVEVFDYLSEYLI